MKWLAIVTGWLMVMWLLSEIQLRLLIHEKTHERQAEQRPPSGSSVETQVCCTCPYGMHPQPGCPIPPSTAVPFWYRRGLEVHPLPKHRPLSYLLRRAID